MPWKLFAATLAAALALSAPAARAAEPGAPAAHTLPDDPKTPVVVLDYQGGMIARKSDEPQLQILADGTVILGAPYGMRKRIESKISLGALQSLLRFIMDHQQFGKFDAKEVQKAIQDELAEQQPGPGGARPLGVVVMDAATTILRVNVDGREHEAKYYALGTTARQYPNIRQLAQLRAIEQRLRNGMNVIYAGGIEGLEEHLDAINTRLAAEHPGVPRLTKEHLTSSIVRVDGSFSKQLSRTEELEGGKRRVTHASLTVPPGGEPEVKLTVSDLPPAPPRPAAPAAGPGAVPVPKPAAPAPKPAQRPGAVQGAWQTLFANEQWYQRQQGAEEVFRGKLEAVPNAGGFTTLQRTSYYKLSARTIYTGAKKVAALDRLVGRQVEIRGKPVDMALEGQEVREIWPAAIRAGR